LTSLTGRLAVHLPHDAPKIDACDVEIPSLVVVSAKHSVRCPEWQRTAAVNWNEQRVQAKELGETAVLLDVSDLNAEHRTRRGTVVAAAGISFQLKEGACLALVGESGSGKTTIARVIAGLHPVWSGQLLLRGERLAPKARDRNQDQRRRIQIVFQSPSDALNPRHSVGEALSWPARTLRRMSRQEANAEVLSLLDSVQLPARYADRYLVSCLVDSDSELLSQGRWLLIRMSLSVTRSRPRSMCQLSPHS